MSRARPVNLSIKVHVHTTVLMKQEAFFIDMSAPRALQEMAKLSLTRRLIVKINTRPQKMSKLGH